jgi:hypothetical protein
MKSIAVIRNINLVATMLLFLTGIVPAYSQSATFPKYTEAVEHFFNTTSLSKYKKTVLNFQKKPSGWYATLTGDNQDTLILIWDSSKQHYADSTMNSDSSSSLALRKKHLDNWEKIHYDACPYFGYKDWDKDVIKDFSNYKGDDAEFIYGIGRAYSIYADNLLSNRSGNSDSTKMFPLKTINDLLTQEQLATYRFYRHKAIELFNKTAELKPTYQTLVGPINLKRDLEYLTSYQDLIQYSTKEEAFHELPDNLFNPFYREYAYNLLMSCDKNGILFVNGDLDTFLPLYLQQKEGIRKDIVVINGGQLGLARYCNYLEKAYNILFSLNDSKTDENSLAYAYIKKDTTQSEWSADKIFRFLNDTTHRQTYKGYSFTTLPTNHFSIEYLNHSSEWNSEAQYIYKYQLLMADVIASNIKHHPVYFATTNSSDNMEGYTHNLIQQIMTYRLTHDYQIIGRYYDNVDVEKSFQFAMKTFHWEHAGEAISHEKMLCINYRINLAKLANKLADENKQDSAMKIIDLCLSKFGNEQLAFDYFTLPVVEAYYKMSRFEEGNRIAKKIVYNFNHDIVPLDDDLIREKAPKYEKLIDDVQELMVRFNQNPSILNTD